MELRDRHPEQPMSRDPSEIGDRIELYQNLQRQHRQWNSLLEKAESYRHSVRASVYDRVRKEYEEKKDALKKETDRVEVVLRRELQQTLDCLERLQEETDTVQEKLEEMNFRICVGELREEELQREIGTLGQRQEELLGDRKKLEEVLRFYAEGGFLGTAGQPERPGGDGDRNVDSLMPELLAQEPLTGANGLRQTVGLLSKGQATEERAPESVPVNGGSHQETLLSPCSPGESHEKTDMVKREREAEIPHGYVTGYLVATSGDRRGERIPLISSNISLGSSPWIDIRLSDPEVNHLHARILYKERKHYLENLDPMGRSLVNGVQTDLVELKDGDVVQLGKVTFQVGYDALRAG